ncbi:MAG: disulfide bond formation protein B, partial [Parvibaculales bacterium]
MPVIFASLVARIALVFGLALAVILVAILSQYWGGLMPCALCLKQRV